MIPLSVSELSALDGFCDVFQQDEDEEELSILVVGFAMIFFTMIFFTMILSHIFTMTAKDLFVIQRSPNMQQRHIAGN